MIPIMMQIGAGSTALSIKLLEEHSATLPMIPIKKIRTAINIVIMKVLFHVAMYIIIILIISSIEKLLYCIPFTSSQCHVV